MAKAPSPWTPARRHLLKADPVLAGVIETVGPCTLRPNGEPFPVLVASVISQMISTTAANTIRERLLAALGDSGFTPAAIRDLPEATLRGVGLSGAKANSIRELAHRALDGRLPLTNLGAMTDEQLSAALTSIKGIGPWTVTMFLIFCLGRPDVLPVGDFGLRAGVRDLYGMDALPGAKALREVGEPWRPYRSVATWYIWRSRGFVPQS